MEGHEESGGSGAATEYIGESRASTKGMIEWGFGHWSLSWLQPWATWHRGYAAR